ncbi:RNA polymerase sigma factor [Pseudonocardia sp. HH130630-07]|uniref:RNA polymerase sigma factor n=1 Tax=Pseudonocardia sp. HH130630-07 TaxID=1690815 RepID=UPI0012EA9977|nr:sigma-70 family RNA polymerase sigma factor [Pseudonocardia sp. HH130630-07]
MPVAPAEPEAAPAGPVHPSWQEFVIADKDELVAASRAYCFALRLPESAADDVFQEACLGLSRIWPRLSEDVRRSPGAYMRGIIHNKARDLRRPKRGNDRLNDLAQRVDHTAWDDRADGTTGLTGAPESRAMDALQRAIDALPGRQREVVVLVKLLDRSIADTAADLGVSTDAVRQSLSRALAALRVQLAEFTGGHRA